jgi:diguanylate cyclase (GGDEF)-like protein
MPGTVETEADSPKRIRARRLVQISSLVMVALGIGLVSYAFKGTWPVVMALAVGMASMGACQYLNHKGHGDVANLVLLGSLLVIVSALMWVAEGLHDVVLLTFPVLLIMTGLLVNRQNFFIMMGFMFAYLVVLAAATDVYHLRVDTPLSSNMEMLRDTLLILAVSGLAVFYSVNDLHGAMAKLRTEIAHFHESQKHLTYLSQHDVLTGLPNRSMGRERILQALNDASRHQFSVALLFVDLDNFKAINDSLGHNVGDDFLKQVAHRLRSAVRKSDIVSRHGGDEFVIGLTDVADIQDVSSAANTILASLTQPFLARDTELATSCSIGIAMFPADGADYESLLRQSDIAMYQAKESGRNAFRFYDAHMNADIQQNLLLVSELRAALTRQEFLLYYQPVVDLATGCMVGAEALVRWQHPQKGLVPPGLFIAAAERSGLIVALGQWVLGEACRQLVLWQAQGCGNLVVAVNLSPVQFRRGNIETVVDEALRVSGLPPQCLELEITESTLIQDTEKFIVSLQRLKALGVKISIDDFGTGYSNLSYLQRFAVDKLKIDQSFVMRLERGPQDRAIVNAIIQMAKSLNLVTTAEGIEDDAVREALLALGCDQGQGYFFARPQPASRFADYFSKKPIWR